MKILIASDGSEFSEVAVEAMCRMIGIEDDTELKIVSAYEQPILTAPAPYAIPAAYNPVLEKELREAASQAVSQTETTISEKFPALRKNLTTRVLCGSPERVIVEEAESWGADLIVTGSHGYGFWKRMFLGSVSNAIAHHAPCSVMIVRKNSAANKN